MVLPSGHRSEAGAMPGAGEIEAMMAFNEELAKAGVLVDLNGLQPTSKGAKIRFDSGNPVVTDGPFSESKEVLGGYWMIQVQSRDEAIEWAKRIPYLGDGSSVEVRQVFEMSDFPAEVQEAADNSLVKESLSQGSKA
jgi:hypothetical protein